MGIRAQQIPDAARCLACGTLAGCVRQLAGHDSVPKRGDTLQHTIMAPRGVPLSPDQQADRQATSPPSEGLQAAPQHRLSRGEITAISGQCSVDWI